MTDTLTSYERSKRMSLVKSKDTKPELFLRGLVHRLGFRYRLHDKNLPGKPDLVFSSRKKIIFLHGCFWHRHQSQNCKLARLPKSKLDFWLPKLEQNRKRDIRIRKELEQIGWQVLVVWECQLNNCSIIASKITKFLTKELT